LHPQRQRALRSPGGYDQNAVVFEVVVWDPSGGLGEQVVVWVPSGGLGEQVVVWVPSGGLGEQVVVWVNKWWFGFQVQRAEERSQSLHGSGSSTWSRLNSVERV
jgi:hypothetical protein